MTSSYSRIHVQYCLVVAGNKNTVLSLWPVDDEATAEFMTAFFGRLAKGVSQPQALADTKRAFKESPKWSDPRYWAGFVQITGWWKHRPGR